MQPGLLKHRAELFAHIRAFMVARAVIEVDVPTLGASTVTDPHLDAFSTALGGHSLYLQTSPEFFMKRLLAAGSGDIYYLGKAFRCEQAGRYHSPEFSMLEWYRIGMDDRDLAREVSALLQSLAPQVDVVEESYQSLFVRFLGCDPHTISDEQLAELGRNKVGVDWRDQPRSTWFDLLFSHCIEPHLHALTIVFDYPACQSALARCDTNLTGSAVARRFEVFWRGIELANGYWELTDAKEQLARFQQDVLTRRQLHKDEPDIDLAFMQAVERGLPDCAGVALGVDRLLMCLLKQTHIADVLPFSVEAR